MSDAKRIALFLDGTWNTADNNTNVWRAKSLCTIMPDQICHYSTGVGTTFGQYFLGGAFGYGLDQEVIQAYEWMVENYNEGDRVYIFGFSRGAFTARALSGLISKCGLLVAGSPLSVQQLYTRYRKGNAPTIRGLDNIPEVKLTTEDRWLKSHSLPIAIWFIGVWDTVGALGIPFVNIPFVSRSDYGFLETDLRIDNDTAYHALAIDEHRKAFAPTLWTRSVPKDAAPDDTYPIRAINDVEQRWFVGAHANVGGGYADDLLAQLPLKWLMQKARARDLVFKHDISIDGNENKATINNSFKEMAWGLYRIAKLWRPFYRTIGIDPQESGGTLPTPSMRPSMHRCSIAGRMTRLIDPAILSNGRNVETLTSAHCMRPFVQMIQR